MHLFSINFLINEMLFLTDDHICSAFLVKSNFALSQKFPKEPLVTSRMCLHGTNHAAQKEQTRGCGISLKSAVTLIGRGEVGFKSHHRVSTAGFVPVVQKSLKLKFI